MNRMRRSFLNNYSLSCIVWTKIRTGRMAEWKNNALNAIEAIKLNLDGLSHITDNTMSHGPLNEMFTNVEVSIHHLNEILQAAGVNIPIEDDSDEDDV
ncbi:hypothetical protein YC2023_032213 [Brassica napus]